ncbi:MAG: hypothetical protein A3C02_01005 [Candidatus Andersenbacteria bacterium RIFCSPHIGHO2_02_FULL_45_11]|uniref:Dihydrofolate reductase n=1 Tax=Candidatus Andersenbacteria bacterium RIFCSPHIGHO2_12_FULL_45_11 TaxID=1797281 RepID=A0A1G1X0P9_9BACT|nr:MAG: hypothetical protein A2805_00500 [Candidatus Andersenbacteria bacterium RIFCSPHIGHO2_01_FULL_46_36]OGY33130.1 MAG: hypothetical protein A3D99_01575 [Candidatus Andersenbacteria bacterium RIFCSPHIGHO2_12_FULL_45_11]OGY33154.1 MAG: hypothetical protein A3C02_01005 [Candidatus Andersenbacteria bacterium RIFCSPHIGHO2_02_FULL_45_11]
MLTIIAAVAANNVIGNNGKTPWNIPEEIQLFKTLTMGHPVIMGRTTFESIGKPLPGRTTIVLSHTPHPNPLPIRGEGIIWHNSIKKALEATGGKDAFVIGGASVYAQMMSVADEVRISHVKASHPGDALFPTIDPTIWEIAETHDYPLFTHIRYIRI